MAESKKGKKTTGPSKTKSGAPTAAKPAAPAPSPFDTTLAASAAAKMVAHGATPAVSLAGNQHETAAFKKLKESLSKPSTQGIANFISSTAPVKKGGQPFTAPNQVKRGQTFGADVNRSGVPRRTGG
jgi:hypothetical protein